MMIHINEVLQEILQQTRDKPHMYVCTLDLVSCKTMMPPCIFSLVYLILLIFTMLTNFNADPLQQRC